MTGKLFDQLPVIATATAAALFLLGAAARGVRRMWHLARDLSEFLAEVRGQPADPGAGRPAQLSLMRRIELMEGSMSRVAALEARLEAHLAEHHQASRQ
jgi:hypothetical protein